MELIKTLDNKRNQDVLLKAIFEEDKHPNFLVKKPNKITEYLSDKIAYVYLGKKEELKYDDIYEFGKYLGLSTPRDFQIDLITFVTPNLSILEVIDAFTKGINFSAYKIFNYKTYTKKENRNFLSLFLEEQSEEAKQAFKKASIIIDAQNYARNLGITPPNELNSEQLAQIIKKDFKKFPELKIKVLNKEQIEKLGMDLLLSVNRGSMYEARVVIIEYKGNPKSDEKYVYVGKGITFDSGGYSLKPPKFMLGMKYDMSGSAIVASAMKAIAQLKPKKNISAIMCITDNRVNGDASLPDSVWTSMSGKTVEINNTDAEGRLVLADGLYYGATKLKATRLVDVATLTGAIVRTLGETYTGVWATTDKAWNDISVAAKKQHELIWRMPFDKDYIQFMKGSVVADLKNTDYSGNAGSCSAAMFLKEFTNNVEYIHCDVAGTNDIDEKPMFAMVKTLIEMAL
ncbi:peptidase M17 [Metamycoplasma hyosynoviae]|uniref:M17 family metallopeptidase n=1 Tax=Metamycoplasma hyosynoviae TaxID=29559 RepID=UPI000461164E|nr:M17 family metallopeptidase [Metamycoplasma hyosynoviae]KDE42323.1 peptidase M17 [Metamycoplasma hyosynoviae]KDE42427.1 peptidase M17 [Metamycoplasma hyosynoviae]KDE42875.1 peptidase M17 [Metamycoplasma hyosynoviae]KDE44220.1 peptidase M17 [Metamycoplasma hyosynoviae]MDC8900998.1 M17 family metallopeptidase [Metamycoplasma hyosynoviae]